MRAALALVAGGMLTLVSGAPAPAETVSGANWFVRNIGDGVIWKFHQFDDLYGSPQSVTVIEADLSNPNVKVVIPYLASTRDLTSAFVPRQYPKALAAVNATFFDTSTGGGGCNTYLRINFNEITPQQGTGWRTEAGIALTDTGVKMMKRPADGWAANTTQRDIAANGPLLVFNGAVPSFDPTGTHCSTPAPRTAIGTTPGGKLLLVAADGRLDRAVGMTCSELAQLMIDLGCDDALSYDGGGSTTAWVAGQPSNGVVNYPSDNGVYDHAGERACSNAVAIIAPATPAPAYDAQLAGVTYSQIMTPGQQQTVTVEYLNTGTSTWAAGAVSLVVARPTGRVSPFEAGSGWAAAGVPARNAVSVAPGARATFTFTMTAPASNGPNVYYEHFGLQHSTAGRFGPPENEPRLKILNPPEDLTVDNGNASVYGSNWSTGTSAADRYGPDYRFKSQGSGTEYLRYRPVIPGGGSYSVYEWHSQGTNRSFSVPHNVLSKAGTATVHVNQQTGGGRWNYLGTYDFAEGISGDVRITDAFPDSGQIAVADAVKFRHASKGAPTAPVDLVLDNTAASFTGTWTASSSGSDRWRENYQWAYSGAAATATWSANLPLAGNYLVQVWHSQGTNRTTNAPYTVTFDGGSMRYAVNQTVAGGEWVSLGTHYFQMGGGVVELDAGPANGSVVVADAVRFVWQSATVPQVLTLTSIATEDGFVVESGENSGTGGSINATATTLRAGDTATRQQIRSILSFNTSGLPDGATIQGITLVATQASNTGTPWATLGNLNVAIKSGTFNGAAALETADFQAAASAGGVATIPNPGANGAQVRVPLTSAAVPYINKTGRTQFRMSFSTTDDNDGTADYFSPYSADDGTAGRRPQLEIQYVP